MCLRRILEGESGASPSMRGGTTGRLFSARAPSNAPRRAAASGGPQMSDADFADLLALMDELVDVVGTTERYDETSALVAEAAGLPNEVV